MGITKIGIIVNGTQERGVFMKVEIVRNESGKIINYIVVDQDFKELTVVTNFIRYLSIKNYSPNTLKNYTYDLRYFFEYFEERLLKSYQDVKPKDLIGFINYLKEQPAKYKANNLITIEDIAKGHKNAGTLSANTLNRILACVSSFYDWVMLSDNLYAGVVIPYVLDYKTVPVSESFKGFLSFTRKGNQIKSRFLKMKSHKPVPRPVESDISKMLLQSLNTYRDKSILLIALQGGLRIGEILGLTFEDVNFCKREVTVRYRINNPNGARVKGSKDRVVQIYDQNTMSCLNNYILYERVDGDSDYIFLSSKGTSKGQPLTYQGINTIFNYHCEKLGLKLNGKGRHLTIHAFRHAHATQMYEGGMSILGIQKRLGHASPQSTQVYMKVSDTQVKEEYKRVIDIDSGTK